MSKSKIIDEPVLPNPEEEDSKTLETIEVEQESEASESIGPVITFSGEDPDPEEEQIKSMPGWVKNLRKSDRQKDKQIKDLKRQLETFTKTNEELEIGPEPKIDDNDINYDADIFASKYKVWHEKKVKVDAKKTEQQQAQQAEQDEWNQTLTSYQAKRIELNAPNFDDAEEAVKETFSVSQQGILLTAAENPALVILALGQNPKRLAELASIKNPVKFAIAISKLEEKIDMKPGKPTPPPPEKPVKGSGSVSSVDSTLENLRRKAADSGDYTELNAYKRQLKKSK